MATNLLKKMDPDTQFHVYDVSQELVNKFVNDGNGRVHACNSSKGVADKCVCHHFYSSLDETLIETNTCLCIGHNPLHGPRRLTRSIRLSRRRKRSLSKLLPLQQDSNRLLHNRYRILARRPRRMRGTTSHSPFLRLPSLRRSHGRRERHPNIHARLLNHKPRPPSPSKPPRLNGRQHLSLRRLFPRSSKQALQQLLLRLNRNRRKRSHEHWNQIRNGSPSSRECLPY